MKIEKIRRCGEGIEVIVNGFAHWFDLASIKSEAELRQRLSEKISKADDFDVAKFNLIKEIEGEDV